jgi:hypothetical protein
VHAGPHRFDLNPQRFGQTSAVINLRLFVLPVVLKDEFSVIGLQPAYTLVLTFGPSLFLIAIPQKYFVRQVLRERAPTFFKVIEKDTSSAGVNIGGRIPLIRVNYRGQPPDDAVNGLIGQVFGYPALPAIESPDEFVADVFVFLSSHISIRVEPGKKEIE